MGRDLGALRAGMWGGLVPAGHSPEMGAGCEAERLAPRGWVLRAAMLMLEVLS